MDTPEMQDTELTQDELTTLKARADMLGISYHPSIGVEKLKAKIEAKLGNTTEGTDDSENEDPPVKAPDVSEETEGQKRQRLRRQAAELVRIRVTCMNPAKREWEGEIITAGNSAVGTFKKYVPFNADEGWHVPRIIYNQLVQRECQVFTSVRDGRGNTVKKGKLIKEFAIEVLPQLTQKELDELARRQAMAKAID